ncbi:MAG: DNA phosphorothioation system sulfurtransferase DndC [Halobacteriota archaeon]|jgi:DNA sulfur modification protein DndC
MEISPLTEEPSAFDTRGVNDIYEEIRSIYLSDDRPWVIGYSGGKDSTTALQLVWNSLLAVPEEERRKPVYVVSTDTFVETPAIADYIDNSLAKINDAAKRQHLPVSATKLFPLINDSFWVNLIGRGYPAPSRFFRWCTERLKIKPADHFILEKVSQHGEIILVLGVRKSESATRAQVMNLYKIKGKTLSRHSKFPQSFVYTPIEDFSTDDVWLYLLQNPSPWGGNNRDLLALYKSASETGECPLVVDTDTPPCGNSRFGCWVCTLVTKDRSVQGLIDNGEVWLEPLLEYRNMLAATQVPENKHLYREYKRRDGTVKFNRNGSGAVTRGPYKLEFCEKLLARLLSVQKIVRENGPDPGITLIRPDELHAIRRIWRMERGNWKDTVPSIYRECTGEDLEWIDEDLGTYSGKEAALLERICAKHKVPSPLVTKLLDVEFQVQGMSRRSLVYSRIGSVLGEEWRSEDEIVHDVDEKP